MRRTARKQHACSQRAGCVIQPGEKYVDDLVPPWTLVSGADHRLAPVGAWVHDRYHQRCADEQQERCPACGFPADYCFGHGFWDDPTGWLVMRGHERNRHDRCDPVGCDQVSVPIQAPGRWRSQ